MNKGNRRTQRLIGALFCFLTATLIVGCVVGPVNWTGSVDAVFKYQTKKKSTVVYKIRSDSNSEKAGVEPGDVLLAVDGQDITNLSDDLVRASLRGPVGSFAVLTLKRGETIFDASVERRPMGSVTSESEKDDK